MMDNFNTNLIESIVRMSNSLRSDSEYIESQSEAKFKDICKFTSDTVNVRIDDFSKLHNSIKVRILRKGIKHILGDTNFIDQKHIEDIMEFENESKINKMLTIPRGVFVYRKKDCITLTTTEIINEEIEFSYNIPTNGFVKIKELKTIIETQTMSKDRYKNAKLDKMSKGFDLNKIKGGIVVRSRQQGDKIKLVGGTKKIKDLFIDLKIPREDRCKVPIISDEQGILQVGEYKSSENYKIDENTKEVLKVSFKKL